MKNLRYNGNISSIQWQNGASAAKSGYKFSYDGEPVQETAESSALYKVLSYNYYTQDHLGNNRVVVGENGIVKQVTNYYPFGGVFSTNGAAYAKSPDAQPYKYNGKELDRTHGLDWYDYGARNYDAIVPIFTSLDPHCESY